MSKELNLFAIYKDNEVYLQWNKIENIDGYRIFKLSDNGEFVGFMTVKAENAILKNIEANRMYEYKVKPFILKNENRDYSLGISAKCKIKTVEFSQISLVINEAYGNMLALSWSCDCAVDGFEIYRNGKPYKNIDNPFAHIDLIEFTEDELLIKGYRIFDNKPHYIAESNLSSVKNKKQYFGKPYNLSVVIPAYNSADYISRTIQTVLASTLDRIELILIDDESTDNTRDIIDWYSEKYPQVIKKIFKKNSGVADTRNVGILAANGKYVAFMDNDDMIRPDGFKMLFEAIEKTQADIVVSPLFRIDNDKYIVRHRLPFKECELTDIDYYLKLIYSDGFNNIGVWNKLYKADLVKSHLFGKLTYEDVSWTPFILSWADTFCYINQICYEWDRKIRESTFSNVLINRTKLEKFKERYEAVRFFYEKGNPKRKKCLAYLLAKKMFAKGTKTKYSKYLEAITEVKDDLIDNQYLSEDIDFYNKIKDLLR